MSIIRPCADLRNNYNEISKICHETKQPVFITKNGTSDLVILSDDTYEKMKENSNENTEAKIEKLISEKFNQHYADFESFKKDFYQKIEKAIKEIEEGKGIPLEKAIAEMEAEYGYKSKI